MGPANFSDWSDGSILPPDHSAIPLVQIPPVWRSCLVFLEDRDFDGISRWFGVDPLAVLKSGWQTITFQRRRGASTLFPPRVRSFVRTVLRSTSESGGTLQALDWLNQQLDGELYAKTGTVSVLGSTRNIHIAGSFVREGRPWSFVVTVGSPVKGHPLGRRLSAGQFAPLAALAVCRPDTAQMALRN